MNEVVSLRDKRACLRVQFLRAEFRHAESFAARRFTFVMEAKSVITFPSGGQTLPGRGLYELTGLAWSGRGRIERVEVTTDG
jgi:hypothetical protein